MAALYILGGLIVLIFGINRLRAGVHVCFGDELRLWVFLGSKKIRLIPKPPPKPKKEKKPPKEEKPAEPKTEKKDKKKKKLSLERSDLWELLCAVWESLQRVLRATGRRIRIDPLALNVTFGGDDPCAVAERYGMACSAMWAVMPRLEQLVQLPDPELHLGMDFSAPSTRVWGEAAVYFRIGDFFAIGLSAVPPLFKWFLGYKKRSRAASKAAKPAEKTDESNEKIA